MAAKLWSDLRPGDIWLYAWSGGSQLALVVSLVETTKRAAQKRGLDVTFIITEICAPGHVNRGGLKTVFIDDGDKTFSWSIGRYGRLVCEAP